MNDDRRDQQDEGNETEESVIASDASNSQNDFEQELEQLKNLSQQLENNYKRALADYQNLQRRTQEEKSEWIRMAGRDMLLKLLPVLDTLMRAALHIQDKGLDLSIDEFLKVLQQENVVRIETKGKEFDPNTMEAVSTQEGDKKEKGKVVEETRAGYMYHDTVLRPAQVIVGQ